MVCIIEMIYPYDELSYFKCFLFNGERKEGMGRERGEEGKRERGELEICFAVCSPNTSLLCIYFSHFFIFLTDTPDCPYPYF